MREPGWKRMKKVETQWNELNTMTFRHRESRGGSRLPDPPFCLCSGIIARRWSEMPCWTVSYSFQGSAVGLAWRKENCRTRRTMFANFSPVASSIYQACEDSRSPLFLAFPPRRTFIRRLLSSRNFSDRFSMKVASFYVRWLFITIFTIFFLAIG